MASGCSLSSEGKNACEQQSDCLSGYVCVERVCASQRELASKRGSSEGNGGRGVSDDEANDRDASRPIGSNPNDRDASRPNGSSPKDGLHEDPAPTPGEGGRSGSASSEDGGTKDVGMDSGLGPEDTGVDSGRGPDAPDVDSGGEMGPGPDPAATCDELSGSDVYLTGTVPSWRGAGMVDHAVAPAEDAADICYRVLTDARPVIRPNRSLVYKQLNQSRLSVFVADDINDMDWAANDEHMPDPCASETLREIFAAPDHNDVIARCDDHYYRVTAANSAAIEALDGKALRAVGAGSVFWTHAGLLLADGTTVNVDDAGFSSAIAVRSHGTGFRYVVRPSGAPHFQLRNVTRDGSVTVEGDFGDPPEGFDDAQVVSAALDGEGDLYMVGWLGSVHSIVEFRRSGSSRVVVKWLEAKDPYGIMLNDWQLLTGP